MKLSYNFARKKTRQILYLPFIYFRQTVNFKCNIIKLTFGKHWSGFSMKSKILPFYVKWISWICATELFWGGSNLIRSVWELYYLRRFSSEKRSMRDLCSANFHDEKRVNVVILLTDFKKRKLLNSKYIYMWVCVHRILSNGWSHFEFLLFLLEKSLFSWLSRVSFISKRKYNIWVHFRALTFVKIIQPPWNFDSNVHNIILHLYF